MAARNGARPAKPARVNVSKVIRRSGKRSPSARSSNAIGFWTIGEKIRQLRDGGVPAAVSRVSEKTRICARELRYCVAVRKAFELDRLQALVDRGMTWSTIRVLAADHMKDHREHLIAAFEAGSLSNAALRGEILAHRRGPVMKGTGPGPGEAGLWEKALQLAARSERLRKDIAMARRALGDGTPSESESAGEKEALTPQTQRKVLAMAETLKALTADIETLLAAVTRRCDEIAPSSPEVE